MGCAGMDTEIAAQTGSQPLNEAEKSRVRDQLRALALPASIFYQPDAGAAEGLEYNTESFANDPVVLDAERREALQEIQILLSKLTPVPADIASKVLLLTSAESVLEIRSLKTEIQLDIKQELEEQELDENLNAPTPEVKLAQLWQAFEKAEQDIQDEFEQWYKQGRITREQMQYLRDERTRLDALPKDGDARIKGEKALAEYQKETGIAVRDDAVAQGDAHAAQAADKVVETVEAQDKRLQEMHNILRQKEHLYHEQKGAEATSSQASALAEIREDTPEQSTKETQANFTVSNATHNDIEAPSGGKERTGRKISKT